MCTTIATAVRAAAARCGQGGWGCTAYHTSCAITGSIQPSDADSAHITGAWLLGRWAGSASAR